MGACQSEPGHQQEENQMQQSILENNNIVLANWKHDQCDGSNQPNQLSFGQKIQRGADNSNIQYNQSQQVGVSRFAVPQVESRITKFNESQRVSVFGGYSQADRSIALRNDDSIQRRPIAIRKNIF